MNINQNTNKNILFVCITKMNFNDVTYAFRCLSLWIDFYHRRYHLIYSFNIVKIVTKSSNVYAIMLIKMWHYFN